MRLGFVLRAFTKPVLNRHLIVSLARRDVEQRFKNSTLGPIWLVMQPILFLALYSFVFQVVLRARWGITVPGGGEVPSGIVLFVGLVLHMILSETLVRAPATITANASLVKRVVFPVEILPLVTVVSSLVSMALSFLLIALAMVVFTGFLPLRSILCIVPVAGLAMFSAGVGWILASLGVYLRDLNQVAPLISSLLLFTAPIVYPIEMVPADFRYLLAINPLTIPVGWCRQILFSNTFVMPGGLSFLAVSVLVYVAGFGFFRILRREFADVL